MLNDAIRYAQTAVWAAAAFVAALVLSVVIPEAFRRRWPLAIAAMAAGAVVAIEVATDQPS